VLALGLLTGCQRAPSTAPAPAVANSSLGPRAQLGRLLFFDPSLSGSGRLSCASCHDPAHAYAPANDRSVQLGGADLKTPGTRAVPSLMYKNYVHAYSDRYENPDAVSPPAPGGGFTWDGRADSLAAQAEIPLLAANEMANADRAALAAKLAGAPYAAQLRQVFGDKVFDSPQIAVAAAGAALQSFQKEDRSFHPYSSKFDLYRANKQGGTLSPQELRGLLLYMAPDKGNCNACHLIGAGNGGSQDISSDYSYAAIGVPRNRDIPANADPAYFDLGLCGPLRQDHQPASAGARNAYCGMFKTPILRNAGTRQAFMHNGVFKSLREVLHFYATRDTQPELWYPKDAQGRVLKFEDLPAEYRGNLDRQMPLDLRKAGAKPPLSEAEIDDLLAFLNTLTDEAFVAAH
jgi:cytochrome c peroxidase